jgi:predicted 2-oxoglutarate/Fe(II)-dependent dioxygenase YbiX
MDLDKPTIRKCAEIAPRGSIVVFPSHVWHRVKPVTKGTRYSLVIWNLDIHLDNGKNRSITNISLFYLTNLSY